MYLVFVSKTTSATADTSFCRWAKHATFAEPEAARAPAAAGEAANIATPRPHTAGPLVECTWLPGVGSGAAAAAAATQRRGGSSLVVAIVNSPAARSSWRVIGSGDGGTNGGWWVCQAGILTSSPPARRVASRKQTPEDQATWLHAPTPTKQPRDQAQTASAKVVERIGQLDVEFRRPVGRGHTSRCLKPRPVVL